MSSSGKSSSSAGSNLSKRPLDPITRTALRYTISPREYELVHRYLISRAPQPVQKRTPNPPRYEKITRSETEGGDYSVAAVRSALRVFIATYAGLKGWDLVLQKLASGKGSPEQSKAVAQRPRHPNARVALAFSSILLFHRLLHRFFRRLRTSLLDENAAPFRQRNPRISKLLTSPYTPAVGAALSGLFLAVSPSEQLRITIAIYILTRSLEFGYNALDDSGCLWDKEKGKPSWFGSWLFMPVVAGQLLHAFVFDRDCFPESYGRFILKRSPEYIQSRPANYPVGRTWPGTFDIVDALAEMSRLRWPPFVSAILFPGTKQTLPKSLTKISPITGPAHPGIKHTSCATLHPSDPSCTRTYIKYWISAFPQMAKFFTLIYGAFALLAYKAMLKDPMPFLNRLSGRILRISLFLTGAIGTSWGSICLFANIFPRSFLPTQRWFLGGFLGGMWAYVARRGERGNFMYSVRLSIDSMYKVGKKRGYWRGVKNGDVLVFVASLALLDAVYESHPGAIRGAVLRKAMGVLRGDGWVDRKEVLESAAADDAKDIKEKKEE